MTVPLPVATPSEQGVDAAGVTAFLEAMDAAPDVELHSLVLLRHGRVVASGWWAPYGPDRLHHLYSLSKTFTATAAGFAVQEGLLDLDETVVGCFPELEAEVTDPRTRAMQVRHLASMTTGHLDDMWEPVLRHGAGEPVKAFLSLPPERDPGTVFAYNQPATYTLAAILQRRTGERLVDYLRPRLLDQLGIGEVAWQQHPPGRDLGFSGLHATTDAIARLGQLYLQRGVWDGRQVLPPGWVEEATRVHVPTPDGDEVDWRQGYGFQVWASRHGYRGDGAYGQLCLVLPEHGAVVAVTGQSGSMQRVLDGVWTHLLPAMAAGGSEAADRELARRLGTSSLTPLPGATAPADPAAWDGASFTPTPGAHQRSLRGARVGRTGDGWSVVLDDDGQDIPLRVEGDRWTTVDDGTVPTSVSGGWVDEGTLRLAVVFVETPHRLTVTCRLADQRVDARWATVPLGGGRLRALRAPRETSGRSVRSAP